MTRSLTKYFVIVTTLGLAACARQDMPRTSGGAGGTGDGAATASGGTGPGSMSEARGADMEVELLRRLHMVNQMEIQSGELAKQKAQSQQVKDYGDRMIRDHRSADERLMAIAQQRGVDFQSMEMHPTSGMDGSGGAAAKRGSGEMHGAGSREIPPDLRQSMQEMERLRTLSGREFDLAYMQQMVKDHEKTLQMIESSRQRVQEPMLQNELTTLESSIRGHHDMARQIFSQLDGDRQNIRGTEGEGHRGTGEGRTTTPTNPQRR